MLLPILLLVQDANAMVTQANVSKVQDSMGSGLECANANISLMDQIVRNVYPFTMTYHGDVQQQKMSMNVNVSKIVLIFFFC